MKRKTLPRLELSEVLQRKYTHRIIKDKCFYGDVALMQFIEISHSVYKIKENKKVYLINKDYYWLQLAPHQENVWLTVIMNGYGEIIEYYFDITNGNHIVKNGHSYFDDLYLDVVIDMQKKITILDEDELNDAYHNQQITYKQYQKALQTKENLLSFLQKNKDNIDSYCLYLFQLLKPFLE